MKKARPFIISRSPAVPLIEFYWNDEVVTDIYNDPDHESQKIETYYYPAPDISTPAATGTFVVGQNLFLGPMMNLHHFNYYGAIGNITLPIVNVTFQFQVNIIDGTRNPIGTVYTGFGNIQDQESLSNKAGEGTTYWSVGDGNYSANISNYTGPLNALMTVVEYDATIQTSNATSFAIIPSTQIQALSALCWKITYKRKGLENRLWSIEGPGRYPEVIELPSDTELESVLLIEDGIIVPSEKYKIKLSN